MCVVLIRYTWILYARTLGSCTSEFVHRTSLSVRISENVCVQPLDPVHKPENVRIHPCFPVRTTLNLCAKLTVRMNFLISLPKGVLEERAHNMHWTCLWEK